MATLAELKSLFGEGPLKDVVEVAICVKAVAIIAEATPSAARLAWAQGVFANSETEAKNLLKYVLAANDDKTVAQIWSAAGGDAAAFQANVSTAIDKLYP